MNIYLFDAKKQQLVLLTTATSSLLIRTHHRDFRGILRWFVEVTREDEEDHSSILHHLSPSLKSWYNKIERITCVRIGVDLYKTGRLNEHDEKSKLVDDVLGK